METTEPVPNQQPGVNGQTAAAEVTTTGSKTPPFSRAVSWFSKQPFSVKLLIGSTAFFLLLMVLLVITSLGNQNSPVVVRSPEPSAQPAASALPRTQSAYSQTAPFQQFEQNLKSLQSFNATVNLSEVELAFPLLDSDVNFEGNR